MVIPSPPGIPVLSPGEMITEEVSDFLLRRQAEGKHFQGAADHTLQTIKVVL
jgi:arginine decarboxylase